jgi:hypothetical protein
MIRAAFTMVFASMVFRTVFRVGGPASPRGRATVNRCSRGDLDNVVGADDFEGVDDVVGPLI